MTSDMTSYPRKYDAVSVKFSNILVHWSIKMADIEIYETVAKSVNSYAEKTVDFFPDTV